MDRVPAEHGETVSASLVLHGAAMHHGCIKQADAFGPSDVDQTGRFRQTLEGFDRLFSGGGATTSQTRGRSAFRLPPWP